MTIRYRYLDDENGIVHELYCESIEQVTQWLRAHEHECSFRIE